MLDGLCDVTKIWIMALLLWRIACLFRKRRDCKFKECPFRKRYLDDSCVYFPSGGCTKCLPTEEERMVYDRTPDGILEYLKDKEKTY